MRSDRKQRPQLTAAHTEIIYIRCGEHEKIGAPPNQKAVRVVRKLLLLHEVAVALSDYSLQSMSVILLPMTPSASHTCAMFKQLTAVMRYSIRYGV